MALETGTYIDDLDANNPPGSDPKSQGDDHLRLIKQVLLNTLLNADRPLDFNAIALKAEAVLLTGNQTVAGLKTFSSTVTANELDVADLAGSTERNVRLRNISAHVRLVLNGTGTAVGLYKDAGAGTVPDWIAAFRVADGVMEQGTVPFTRTTGVVGLTTDQRIDGYKSFQQSVEIVDGDLAVGWDSITREKNVFLRNSAAAVRLVLDQFGTTTGMYRDSGAANWIFGFNVTSGEMTHGTVPWGRVTGFPGGITSPMLYKCSGRVDVAGVVQYVNGCTISKISTGRWRVTLSDWFTFPNRAVVSVSCDFNDEASNTGPMVNFRNLTSDGFEIQTRNGGSTNSFNDITGFSWHVWQGP